MQFEENKRIKLNDNDENTNPYPFWINFYITPPTHKATLQEIEDVVSERLKLLQVFDNLLKNLGNYQRNKSYYDVMRSQISSVKGKNGLNFFVVGRSQLTSKVFEARKRDHTSHFLLRIYYCQTAELRKWYVSRETEMFRYRLLESSSSESSMLQDCLAYYGYKYEIVSIAERTELHELINWSETNRTNLTSIAFKLNFEDALDLVRTRKVYLSQGFAYIPASEMISVLCNEFRVNLSRELSRMHTHFDLLDDQRLITRLESLHNELIGNSLKKPSDGNQNSSQITAVQIEPQSKELFPPCMRSIHETLRTDHHLKHYGRLHYGLFLKSAGLSLEDSIDFFRAEMSIHNPEKFQKEYSYTIRYIYGREGKRVQLSAYSCQKIINGNAPGPTDTHGCPFKHFDVNNLKALLIRYGVNDDDSLDEIIQMVSQDGNATGACSKFFSIKLGSAPQSETIYHPNQYYTEARRLLYAPQLPAETSINENESESNVPFSGDTTIDSTDASLLSESIDQSLFDETDLNEMETIS